MAHLDETGLARLWQKIKDLVNSIDTTIFRKVDSLNPAGGEAQKIYLVPRQQGGYEAWVYLNPDDGWVDLRETNIDLSDCSLKNETISNITRNDTTFIATRADGTTFTFDQKDSTFVIPINPTTVPTENGAVWFTT